MVSLVRPGVAESRWVAWRRRRASKEFLAHRPIIDAAGVLSLYVAVLMLVPANLTVPALGSVGTPALIIGVGAGILWLGAQLSRATSTLSFGQPVRRALTVFVIAVLLSYSAAMSRPLESIELAASDRGLLLLASIVGIVLLAGDGVFGFDRIERPLRVLVFAGGIVATLGIIQFATGLPIIDAVTIPGLTPNTDLTSIYDRAGFTRVAGTATHPIEFGVTMAMILPVALHFAVNDSHRHWMLRWYPVLAIVLAIPITISRSALVAVVVVLLFVLPTWPPIRRWMAALLIAMLLAVIYVTIPGMLGTWSRLFTGISEDGSALSRTNSYELAIDYFVRDPLFGRGFSTFVPQYRILDNQYLGFLIEIGIVGTVSVLALFTVAIGAALSRRQRTVDARAKSLALSLAAMTAAGACSFATFDALGFPQVSGLTFLAIGLIGGLSNTIARAAHAFTPYDRSHFHPRRPW